MAVSDDSDVWYFDSGATKHITSHRDMFTFILRLSLTGILSRVPTMLLIQ